MPPASLNEFDGFSTLAPILFYLEVCVCVCVCILCVHFVCAFCLYLVFVCCVTEIKGFGEREEGRYVPGMGTCVSG